MRGQNSWGCMWYIVPVAILEKLYLCDLDVEYLLSQYLQQWLDHFSLFLLMLFLVNYSGSEGDQQLDMLLGRQPLLIMRLAMLVMTRLLPLLHKCSG